MNWNNLFVSFSIVLGCVTATVAVIAFLDLIASASVYVFGQAGTLVVPMGIMMAVATYLIYRVRER